MSTAFADVLTQYSVAYQTEGRYSRPGWVQFACPFCSGGSDPSKLYCGYNTAYGYVNCWRCGKHSVVDTIAKLAGVNLAQAKALAADIPRSRTDQEKQAAVRGTVS